jgi:hypothetical protein
MRHRLLLLPFVLALSLLVVVTVAAGGPVISADSRPGIVDLPAVVADRSVAPVGAMLAADIPITTPLLSESFEDTGCWPSADWTRRVLTGTSTHWFPSSNRAYSGTCSFYHNDDYGWQDAWLVTPRLTPTNASELVFWQSENYTFAHETHSIWISAGSGDPKDGDFTRLAELGPAPDPGWEEQHLDVSDYSGRLVYLAFRYEGDNADEWYIDEVGVTSGLIVACSGPRMPGEVVTLTAYAPTGSNVSYVWDLGGGVIKNGAVITHVYDIGGSYTAVVTGSNSVSTVTETLIFRIGGDVYLPLVLRNQA